MQSLSRLFLRVERLILWLLSLQWRPTPTTSANIRRVAVIEMTRLGDVVASTALLGPLKKAFPEARFEWWVRQGYEALFDELDSVRVVSLPSGWFAFLVNAWSLRRQLQSSELLVVSASPALRHSLLALLSRPARAVGYIFPALRDQGYLPAAVPQDFSFNQRRVGKALSGDEHMVTRALASLSAAGLAVGKAKPDLGKSRFHRQGVLIHPGANWSWRRWPLERFVSLALSLQNKSQPVSIIFDEQTLMDCGWSLAKLQRRCEGKIKILHTKTLTELLQVCRRARLFIGNDSGPLHLAAAAGCTCLGLYGPNLPQRSGPWPLPASGAGPHQVLEGEAPCRPCEQLCCELPKDWCMEKLTQERVLVETRKMLR